MTFSYLLYFHIRDTNIFDMVITDYKLVKSDVCPSNPFEYNNHLGDYLASIFNLLKRSQIVQITTINDNNKSLSIQKLKSLIFSFILCILIILVY